MDRITNPFSPGAGAFPPELAGRDSILEDSRVLFGRIKIGRPEKSIIMTGLRGVGKTVLLNKISEIGIESGYRTVFIEAHEDKSLAQLLAPNLRTLLFELDRIAGMGDKARRGLAVLKSFVSAIKVKAFEVEVGLDIDPEKGAADSGDLETDLPNLFEAVAEAGEERNIPVAILIDEIQYLSSSELSALIMAMHRMQQKGLPLVLVAAGLPILAGMAGDSKSYAERLFSFPDIGPLQKPDALKALEDPVAESGEQIDRDATLEIFSVTQGYPYFLQEWGYQTWNQAQRSPISLDVVRETTNIVTERLDKNFFRVRFDRLTPTEKDYLRAMAELGPGPYLAGSLSEILGRKLSTLSPIRSALIKKGMIFSPNHGEIAFTVPLFDEFMRRAIPKFSSKKL